MPSLIPLLLLAIDPSISIKAGDGAFVFRNLQLKAKGPASDVRVEFKAVLENTTRKNWGHARFCVTATDTNGDPMIAMDSQCLFELTAINLPATGTIQYKYSPRVVIGSGRQTVTLGKFEISLISGGQDAPNTRLFSRDCNLAWSSVLPILAKKGLMPESSDKAGGFLRLRYTLGNTGWLRAERDINVYTAHRVGFLENYDSFEVSGGSLSLTPDGDNCRALMQFEFRGLRKNFSNRGVTWYALPSNGMLENTILHELEMVLEKTKKH